MSLCISRSVQQAVDLTYRAFDLAEKYRTIVILAIDGNIGQMMGRCIATSAMPC